MHSNTPSIHSVQTAVPIETLHARLGHLSWSTLKRLSSDIDPSQHRTLLTCEGCLLGKSTWRKFTSSTHRRAHPFDLVHMDLAGPMKTQSVQGNFYHFVIVDNYTRYKWVFFLKGKDETFSCFKRFHALVSTHYQGTLRAARSDCGGEFLSTEFIKYLEEQRIQHQLTAPHTPQQNGVAKRTNCTVAEAARAMLQSARMTNGFWECAVATATHVRNRAPTRVNEYKSPHERLHGQKPDLSYLRTFGCLAYAHTTTHQTKFDPMSQKLVFIGYNNSTKGYTLWNPLSRKTIVSTDVVFEETVFPLHTAKSPTVQPSSTPESPPPPSPEQIELMLPESDDEDDSTAHPTSLPEPPTAAPAVPPQPPVSSSLQPSGPSEPPPRPFSGQEQCSDPSKASPDQITCWRSNFAVWTNTVECLLTVVKVTPAGDPNTYEYVISTPEAPVWQVAMKDEITSLLENGTWELVDLPRDRKAIKCKWVFVTKRDTQGNVTRLRARLVAKGFSQTTGIDYEETFAPVARLDSLRLLLVIVAHFDLDVHHIYVKSAYLNGYLDEEIYMEQPEGFVVKGQESKVCCLKKALYGLKQAGRQWHTHLHSTLASLGFQKNISGDVSIFIKRTNGENHSLYWSMLTTLLSSACWIKSKSSKLILPRITR